MKLYSLVLFLIPSFVHIGDANNSPASNGYGSVNYDYEIAATELTNEEYCQFLNVVAQDADPYKLYSSTMSSHFMGGIDRIEDSGKYEYKVKEGYELLPVSGISWMSAARYANWLHYNSENIENKVDISQFYKLTEGDENHGAYNTSLSNHHSITRNAGAKYWIPNRNEWLKAAYFNGKTWNENWIEKNRNIYDKQKGWSYSYPHLKVVGKGSESSYYGTYDQQGNVAEWVEDRTETMRMALGGSCIRPANFATFDATEGDFEDKGVITFGVRIARDNSKNKRLTPTPKIEINNEFTSINNDKFFSRDKNGGTYVRIGDAKNNGDPINQYKGRVNYEYEISRYELTNDEYCNFLNSVASVEDKYGLYNSNMSNGVSGGINRIIRGDSALYVVKSGWGKRPVVYIGYYELARYANWMHYGCPNGKQVIGVTEGNDTKGAYDTRDFEDVRTGKKPVYGNFGVRNVGAMYWIPNDDEWYKAAYYDPSILGHRKYHDYPTRTSLPPTKEQANYMVNNELNVGSPYFVCEVDEFQESASYYGTCNQGGNVWEWIESWQYGVPGNRTLRGGSWQYTEQGLYSGNEDPGGIDDRSYLFGGRLCRSIDADGYRIVKTDAKTNLYEWLMKRPKNHLIFGLGAVSFLALIGFCFMLIFSFKYIWRLKSKLRGRKK